MLIIYSRCKIIRVARKVLVISKKLIRFDVLRWSCSLVIQTLKDHSTFKTNKSTCYLLRWISFKKFIWISRREGVRTLAATNTTPFLKFYVRNKQSSTEIHKEPMEELEHLLKDLSLYLVPKAPTPSTT